MRKIAILVCIAAAPFLFALNPALASQDTESEAKAIFRTWKSQDAHPETGPWDEYKKDPIVGAIWQDLTPTRDQLWINSKDVTRNGGVVTFWMRGDYPRRRSDHARDARHRQLHVLADAGAVC